MTSFIPYLIILLTVIVTSTIIGYLKYKNINRKKITATPLKAYGNKIRVYFDNCEIKTQEYYEDIISEKIPTRLEMLDSLHNSNKAMGKVKKTVSVVIYHYKNANGDVKEYKSLPIYLQADMLRYHLMKKRETFIYVDPQNKNHYYFDTDFIYVDT